MDSPRFNLLRAAQALLLAVIISAGSLQAPAQGPAAAQAPEAPPIRWPRSHNYDVQHYKIVVGFDWSKKSVSGETTMSFQPFANDLREIEVDAGEMTINSVKLAQGNPLKFTYDGKKKLLVALDRAYQAGQTVSITINYAATPKKGLTFITPTETDPNRPYQIWSQGEAEDNHYWFPCYDYPNDKATTEMVATVEDKYQVISNGALVKVQPNAANKTRTWHWKMDQPFSSYLISIIVGQYVEVKEQYKTIPVISNVYPGQTEEAKISFGDLSKMVAFYSERIGYEYPYSKYAQTMVRDFPGAMENITSTTMTDTTVHDRRAHLDVSSDEIVAHELVHQWFGNMLTLRDWSELWLNESFAVFFGGLWTEHEKGKDDFLYEMHGNQQQYFAAWFQGNRRPIVTMRYYDPDALFDVYAYPRGGAVLNMLRFVLGDEMFWKAVRHYTRKHQWQNVTTSLLITAIEEATGQNLQWFFDEWVYRMGHPEFEITSEYDGASALKLVVKQTQRPDEKRPWFQSPEFFTMPVDIAVTTQSGEKVHRVWIDGPQKEFTFQVDSKPLIVNFDRGNYLIKQVKFNRGDEELGYQMTHDSDTMGRVGAAIELRSSRSDTAARALTEAVRGDKFWGVRLEAAKTLSLYKNDAARAALLEAVKDPNSKIRRQAIEGLAAFKDTKLADLFINVINSDQSYFAVAEAAKALGQSGSPQAFEVLMNTLKQESWQDTTRAGALAGLSRLKDPRTLESAFKYAAPGNSVNVRAAALQVIADAGKGDDRALQVLTSALKEQSLTILFTVIPAIGTFGDPRAIPALEEFAKGPLPQGVPEYVARDVIGNIIKQLRQAAKQPEKKN